MFVFLNSITDLFLFIVSFLRVSGMRILTKTRHSNTALVQVDQSLQQFRLSWNKLLAFVSKYFYFNE